MTKKRKDKSKIKTNILASHYRTHKFDFNYISNKWNTSIWISKRYLGYLCILWITMLHIINQPNKPLYLSVTTFLKSKSWRPTAGSSLSVDQTFFPVLKNLCKLTECKLSELSQTLCSHLLFSWSFFPW